MKRQNHAEAYSQLISLLEELRTDIRSGGSQEDAFLKLEAFLSSKGEAVTDGTRNGARYFLNDVAIGSGDEERLDLIRGHASQFASWPSRVRRAWIANRARWLQQALKYLGLVLLVITAGFAAVELFGVSNLGPGYWPSQPWPLIVIGYAMIGAPSLIVVGILLVVAIYAVIGIGASVIWLVGLPLRVARWFLRTGLRGFIGYVLIGGFATVMVGLLAWLGRFTIEGFMFWLEALAAWALIAFWGGAAGAFGLAMGSFLLALVSGDRIPVPLDDSRAANGLTAAGFVGGSAIVWHLFAADRIAHEAAIASVPLGAWSVWLLTALYIALWVGLWRAVRLVRGRAGLLPELGVEQLVWQRSGQAPPKPTDEYWSPSPIIAWRSWEWDGRALIGHHGARWKDQELVARCERGHSAPTWRCNCGVYGLRAPPAEQTILGQVELTGVVVEHEEGYRAEKARIIALWVSGDDNEAKLEAIQKAYPELIVMQGSPPHADTERLN